MKRTSSFSAADSPAVALARTMRQIYDIGLTTTSGGNLSVRDENGDIWITPAGLDKGELLESQVARVSDATTTATTTMTTAMTATKEPAGSSAPAPRPSSELPFHRSIYAARSDIHAIVHAHPVSLVAFSIARQVPNTLASAHGQRLCGEVGFADYALPGSSMLGDAIATTFAKGFACVILENHGVVVGGASLREAFERLEALDLCARTIVRARILDAERLLTEPECQLVMEARPAKSRHDAKPNALDHAALREQICALAVRANSKRLMTSTQGVLSARLSKEAFLLTPHDRPLDQLEPTDLLLVDATKAHSTSGDANRALHAAVYAAHPSVGAIAQGYGECTTAFSTAGLPLPAGTIPESYILIREPGRVSLREKMLLPESVAAQLCPDRPVALIQNDGAIVLGASPLDAFDRLEVLEATASALISSRALGPLLPMDDARLEKLRLAFFPDGGFQGAPHGGAS